MHLQMLLLIEKYFIVINKMKQYELVSVNLKILKKLHTFSTFYFIIYIIYAGTSIPDSHY